MFAVLWNFAFVFVFGVLPLMRLLGARLGPADLTGRRTTVFAPVSCAPSYPSCS